MKRIPGVVVGIVKSLNDPKGEGRIQLEFPGLPGGQTSGWAPIAAPMAGKNRGAYLMPEKDDEVLVAFEQGDFNHPFIVGFLWNGVDRPPEKEPKNRVILTPGGHTLRFEDKDGAKKVVLKSNGGYYIEIDDTANSVTVNSSGATCAIKLNGGGRIFEMSGSMVKIS